jgi:prepilin-type processing-associated H-X9-DG protein
LRAYYRDKDRVIWTSDHKYIEEPVENCPSRELKGDGREYMMTVLIQDGVAGAKPFTTFTHPSQTPLFWDGFNPGSGNMRNKIPLRHNGGINMAFLDGHIEYLDGDDKRLYNDYFYTLFNSGTPNPAQLGRGQKLGVTSL